MTKKEENTNEPIEEKPDEDTITAQLKKLGLELAAVASDEMARKEKLGQIEGLLGNLKIKDFEQLAESPVIQGFVSMFGGNMRPGEVKNKGSLAEVVKDWEWRDLQEMVVSGEMPLKKFFPRESIDLCWNGLSLHVDADTEVEVPACFFDIYKDHVFAVQQAEKGIRYRMGLSEEAPHPNWQTPEGAVVRAISLDGKQYGRPGGSVGVGPIQESGPSYGAEEEE